MTSRLGSLVAVLVIALSGVAVPGLSPAQTSSPLPGAAEKEGAVTWYTVWPQWLVDRITQAWAARHPNVKLSVFRSGSSKVAAKIIQERETGRILGDVVTLTEEAIFVQFKRDGILEPYVAPEFEAFPPRYRDPSGAWATPRVVVLVLWYNVPRLASQGLAPPQSWAELVEPRYRGKAVFASPLYSGTMTSLIGATVPNPTFGWAYWESLGRNAAHFINDVPDVARAVAAGEREIGATLWGYIDRYPLHPKGTIAVVVPKEGAVVIQSSTALLVGRPHPHAGKLLQRFLLSAEVGRFVSEGFEYSPRSDVPPPPSLPPLADVPVLNVDTDWMLRQRDEIRERWPQIVR